MSDISTWSETASDNNNSAPDGFPEGMPPGGVNDAAREVMAAIRRWYDAAEWIDPGLTPTRTGGTTFTVSGGQTALFTSGRRFRAGGSSTVYGTILSSSFSNPDTTVTVICDSGSLPSSLESVAVGILSTGSANSFPKYFYEAVKAADTSRTSTAVLANDTNLLFTVPAGTYAIDAYLAFRAASGGTQGFQAGFAVSTGSASVLSFAASGAVSGSATTAATPSAALSSAIINSGTISTSATGDWLRVSGTVTLSAACIFSLQWAQQNSNAAATLLMAGSRLLLRKIG